MQRIAVLLFPALLLLSGCPPDLEVSPGYILVENFELRTPSIEGSTSDITEVWAFADNEFIGAYRLPARIPVFKAGATTMRLEAGIRQNGISTTPEIYQFYTPVVREVELASGQSIDMGILPITYRENVKFGFIENFESNARRIFTTPLLGSATLEPSREFVRSGEFSGRLRLDEDDPLVEIASDAELSDLFAAQPNVWLEMDFRSDAPVAWGVTGRNSEGLFQAFDPTFAPRDEWTKIYFNMTQLINDSGLDELEIYLSTILTGTSTEAEVYLDNIRLIHF